MIRLITLTTTLLISLPSFSANLMFGANRAQFSNGDYCQYDLTVPVIAPAGSNPMTQGLLELNLEWQSTLNQSISEFNQAIREEGACQDTFTAYDIETDFNIKTSLAADVTSIQMNYYGYMGGAHGNSASQEVTFVSATGERVTDLGIFLNDVSLATFKAVIDQKMLEKEHDLEFGWNEIKNNWTSFSQVTNYYLTSRSLVISFDPYEVGPYAAGPIELEIYGWELSEYSFKDSEVAKMIKKQLVGSNN